MLVSLELPGNIKVWLRCQCQVIFAVKQSVSFYNHGEDRKERICPDANTEIEMVFKDKWCELVKKEHCANTNPTGSDLTFPPVHRDPR